MPDKITTPPRRLQYLDDILKDIADSPIPSHIFQVLADFTYGVIKHDLLALLLREDQEDNFRVHLLNGQGFGNGTTGSLQTGLIGQSLETKKPFCTDNLGEENLTAEAEPLLGEWHKEKIRSIMVSPIIQSNESIGALLFASKQVGLYQEEDTLYGSLLSSAVAAALENSRLYQALSDEQVTLKAILQSSQDAILLFNDEGRILMANPAAAELLGATESEILGKHLNSVSENTTLTSLLGESGSGKLEIKFLDQRIFQVNLSDVQTEYGEVVGRAALFRDITLLKELDQMKTEFVQTVSHDLKNPISSVLLDLELLQEKLVDDRHNRRVLRMTDTLEKMNQLVVDLLDLGKFEAGMLGEKEPMNFARYLEKMTPDWQLEASKKSIQLHLAGEYDGQITANANRITQVLTNLVGNAIQYTTENGTVTIRFENLKDSVVKDLVPDPESLENHQGVAVHISDSGLGIPEKDIPYLFDRFYRVKQADRTHIPGNGLGLSIVKSIIESHNGKVWVSSKLGQGSTFSFYLPA